MATPTAGDAQLADAVLAEWLDGPTRLSPVEAMNSSAWLVDSGAERFVLKVATPSNAPGLAAAEWLESRGFRAGAPLRMTVRQGRLVALLRFVEGEPLDHADVDVVGETLGRVHRELVDAPVPAGIDCWPWTWLDSAVIAEPALRSAARAAIARAEDLAPGLTHGILHGDPAPEAFLRAADDVGLIDWGAACHGPLLYDVASAFMYVRNDQRLIDAYARTGPLSGGELAHTTEFLAFRLALQAWYFSMRLATNDPTGPAGLAGNEEGLAHARGGLLESPSARG
jgi:Ser/Thr protein kinase RdoA (MazF antagonist)